MHAKKLIIQLLICFGLGSFSTFSLEPYKIYPLIFCFSYFILIIYKFKSLKDIFLLSWAFAFGWFLFGLYWIGHAFLIKSNIFLYLMPFAAILLPLFLSLIWAFAFLLSKWVSKKIGEVHINLTIILSIVEYFRGNFLNFPWLMPGNFFSSEEYLLQGFSFIGSYSMNLVFFILIILPILIFKYYRRTIWPILLLSFPIICLFFNSYYRYNNRNLEYFDKIHMIKIIQPNIKQKLKWKKRLKSSHHMTLVDLSQSVNQTKKALSVLYIWPETALLGVYPRDKNLITNLSQKFLNKNKEEYLFTGIISKKKNKYYNSAILLNSKKQIENIYNKNILVPFGEYLPLRNLLPKIKLFENKVDFLSGKKNMVIAVNNFYNFIPLICYEIIFSNIIFKSMDEKTSLIVNITNDAWFGNSIGPVQHFQFSKIRAAEFGIPVVRVANTGFSGFISPYGEVLEKLQIYEKGSLSFNLINKLETTLYKKYGDKIFLILILVLYTFSIVFNRKIQRKENE